MLLDEDEQPATRPATLDAVLPRDSKEARWCLLAEMQDIDDQVQRWPQTRGRPRLDDGIHNSGGVA